MSWRCLPPAGEPIDLRGDGGSLPSFPDYQALWLSSGTGALALALQLARMRHPEISAPEVVLPGYACPDLVAAAVYAGVRPVLADIGAEDPGYDLAALRNAVSPCTVAVVAVNFLGIRERLLEIRELLRQWPAAALIEDDAQWFPEGGGPVLTGDAVCISFGRGKPVSLLGGGALFVRQSYAAVDALRAQVGVAMQRGLGLKARVYNMLLHPMLYGLLGRNPLLSLGRTVFKPLQGIAALDAGRQAVLPRNVARYLSRAPDSISSNHDAMPQSMSLPARLKSRTGRLLRYPVLCPSREQRDRLLQDLRRQGLGATAMYGSALPDIANVAAQVSVKGDLRGSRHFAGRLLTLPVHSGVTKKDVARIQSALRGCFQAAGGDTGP